MPSLDFHVQQRRGGLGPIQRFYVRVPDRDHVAATVAVETHGPDRLTLLEEDVGLDDARKGQHLVERADARDLACRQRPGLCCQEPDRERLPELWRHELVRHLEAERLRNAISTRSTPTAC